MTKQETTSTTKTTTTTTVKEESASIIRTLTRYTAYAIALTVTLITSPFWITLGVLSIVPGVVAYLLWTRTVLGDYVSHYIYKIMNKVLLHSGKYQSFFWKWFYDYLSTVSPSNKHTLQNLGYADMCKDGVFLESQKDSAEVLQIQLYHHAVIMHAGIHDLAGKTIVDVSSGRGGGLNYLVNELKPKAAYGIDVCPHNVEMSQQFHKHKHVEFVNADAESIHASMKKAEKAVDVVVNVESSHCYFDLASFFDGVSWMLKDDGVFVFSDMRHVSEMKELHVQISKYFTIEKREDIRRHVLHSVTIQSEAKKNDFYTHAPWYLRYVLKEFIGVDNTYLSEQLKHGHFTYFSYVLKKKVD